MRLHFKKTETAADLCDFVNKYRIKPVSINNVGGQWIVYFYKL